MRRKSHYAICFTYFKIADVLGIDSGELYINNIVLDNVIEEDTTFKNIDKLIENEPQYLIFSHSLFLSTIERKQIINSLLPYLKIGLNFNRSKNSNANESFESDLFRNWAAVFLSVDYDFQIKSKKIELQKIKVKKDLYSASMQSFKDSVLTEIRKKISDLNNKKELFNLSQQETKLAYKQLSVITGLYKNGIRDQYALLNARETYLLSEKKRWNSFLSAKYAHIDLDKITGAVIDRFVYKKKN